MLRLRAALTALALALAACAEPADERPRHLVVISLDTLRADHVGSYGYTRDTSNALDRWAHGAAVFERAVAPSNATVASHHALFQSQPASRALARRDSAPTLAAWLREQGFRTAAFTGGGTLSRATGFARGFERWDEENPALAQGVPKALRFLDEVAKSGERSFLFLHCFDVHLPYDPPPAYARRFSDGYQGPVSGPATLPLLRGVRRIFEQAHAASPPRLDAADRAEVVALYDAEIANADAQLARLLRRLDAPDLREHALVVILSDHGEEFWDHGSVLHAHTLYQELLHVPLLLRGPSALGTPRRIAARVSLLDVVPTALELLGVPPPPELAGRSLRPLLAGAQLAPRPAFAEGFAFDARLQAVLDGELKAIRDLTSGRVALFDLEDDPAEQRDLAASRPDDAARLRALLDATLGAAPAVQEPLPLPETVEPATEERLRALGYID